MIAKLCAYGPDRATATRRLREALDAFVIRGPGHNIPFLAAVLANPRFAEGRLSTGFIAEEYGERFRGGELPEDQRRQLAAVAAAMGARDGGPVRPDQRPDAGLDLRADARVDGRARRRGLPRGDAGRRRRGDRGRDRGNGHPRAARLAAGRAARRGAGGRPPAGAPGRPGPGGLAPDPRRRGADDAGPHPAGGRVRGPDTREGPARHVAAGPLAHAGPDHLGPGPRPARRSRSGRSCACSRR